MYRKSVLLVSFLFFAIYFIACRKETKGPSWDVDVLAPLVKSTLTINNIISDTLLNVNSDNSLDIIYKTSLSAFSSNSIFLIPDTLIDTLIPLIPSTLPPCSVIIPPSNDQTKYPLGDVELSKVILRSGKMKIAITNSTDGNIEFIYKIPLAVLSGQPFETTFIVPKRVNSTTPGVYSATYDLAGYNFDLRGLNGDKFNTIVKNVSIKVPCSEPTINLQSGDYIKMDNSFLSIVPQYAQGYFGQTVSNIGPDSTDFSIFSHIIDGTLDLEDIDIGLSIQNSIGADARVTINNISSINTRKGTSVALSNSSIGSPLNINRSVDNSGVVSPTTYSVALTSFNSNIKQFMENLPDRLSYQLDMEINPLGNASGGNDFIYYDKLMKTEMNMTIPLSLIANNLTIADTLDFNMPSNADNVNSGSLNLYVENGFPFTAEAQLYLMDASLNIVDSLISLPNIILAPQLDVNNICVGQKSTVISFPVNEEKISLLRETDKMYIKLKFNTAGQPAYVKLYSFYEMDVKLVGDFNYTVGK